MGHHRSASILSFSFASLFSLLLIPPTPPHPLSPTAELYSSEVVCGFSSKLGGGAVHVLRFLVLRWLWLLLLQNGQLQQRLETVQKDFIVFNREK